MAQIMLLQHTACALFPLLKDTTTHTYTHQFLCEDSSAHAGMKIINSEGI